MNAESGTDDPTLALGKLTLQLVLSPERAWPGLLASGERALPTPLRHAVTGGAASVLATGLGWSLRPGSTYAGTVLHMLAAVLGYVGAACAAVVIGPSLLGTGRASAEAARYASGAALPVVLSGVGNLIPLLSLCFALALAGAALSVRSAMIGAGAMFAAPRGPARWRAAAVPTGLAVGSVVAATCVRAVLPQ